LPAIVEVILLYSLSPHRLSFLPTYYIPKDGPLQTYKVWHQSCCIFVVFDNISCVSTQDYISQLPNVDHPEAFGQHSNADIASQIKETRLGLAYSVLHVYLLPLLSKRLTSVHSHSPTAPC